jgi:hypothetical protein
MALYVKTIYAVPGCYVILSVGVIAAVAVLIIPVCWWWLNVRMVHAATGSMRRAVAAAIGLPLSWAFVAAFLFLTCQVLLNYVMLLAKFVW